MNSTSATTTQNLRPESKPHKPESQPTEPQASMRSGGWTIQPSLPDQRVSDDLIAWLASERQRQR